MSSSNSPLPPPISKNASVQTQTPSPSQAQTTSSFGAENHPQRRNGGTGSFGAGSTTRASPAARNSQPLRKQHKGQRRPRLADEDAAAESAVMQSTRNRKGQTSITHLMNFVLPPRPQNHSHSNNARNSRRNPTWGLGSGYHAADKARYIHANYRFIVDPQGDYRAQALDADVHLDWGTVLQILASAKSQSASCPICLSHPKRPRWKKCPICWDSVYVSETRPVRWFTGQEGDSPQEGCDVVLRLITRQPGSTLALPRDGAASLESGETIPWYFAAEMMDYARVMKGGEDYMTSEYDREIEELQQQEREDELVFGEETQWTQKAIAAISELKGRLKGLGNPPVVPAIPNERKSRRAPLTFREHHSESPEFHLAQHTSTADWSASAKSLVPGASNPNPQPSTDISFTNHERMSLPVGERSLSRTKGAVNHPSTLPFFFYEALQHFYLSPLDIRILRAAFGDFSSFPSTILPRVERVSTGHIVDDELRRRAKYLAHLPRGCEVAFLECDWTDTVSPEVLSGFSGEIERRRKRNHEKEAREEKERVRAEKKEDDERWAAARRRRPALPPDNFTSTDSEPVAVPEAAEFVPSSSDSAFTRSSPPWPSSRAQAGLGFASLASPSTSPSAPRTVWGTAAIAPPASVPAPIQEEPPLAEHDGWLQNWEEDLLPEDDLAVHLEASSIADENAKAATTSASSKKKKGKKITLMSTNARRGA
ncbi:MAG: hypothetical protein LQ349_000717 [Xanthoria aureola]|nr:MAG: hypothetical protein LQ349_000717 [Xanthoria aureola]